MLQLVLAFHQKGCLDEAEALYREILRSQPDHFNALQFLATIVAQKMNSLKAIELFDKALNINHEHASSLNNSSKAFKELKRHEKEVLSYDMAIALNPDHENARFYRGNAMMQRDTENRKIFIYQIFYDQH